MFREENLLKKVVEIQELLEKHVDKSQDELS